MNQKRVPNSGSFEGGNPGGPGRPTARAEVEYQKAISDGMSPAELTNLVRQNLALAQIPREAVGEDGKLIRKNLERKDIDQMAQARRFLQFCVGKLLPDSALIQIDAVNIGDVDTVMQRIRDVEEAVADTIRDMIGDRIITPEQGRIFIDGFAGRMNGERPLSTDSPEPPSRPQLESGESTT